MALMNACGAMGNGKNGICCAPWLPKRQALMLSMGFQLVTL